MKQLLRAVCVFVCLLGLAAGMNAQTTTITASNEKLGGYAITTGTVTLTPVNTLGIAIPFADGTGAQNGPTAFSCAITTGAISGMVQNDGTVSGTCTVPDATETIPANILYAIQVCDTSTGLRTSGKCFTLQQVVGVSGATWALDHYGPPAQTTNVQIMQVTQGKATPNSCTGSVLFTNTTTGLSSVCVGGDFVPITGGPTTASGVVTLFDSGSCSGFLKSDGTCSILTGAQVVYSTSIASAIAGCNSATCSWMVTTQVPVTASVTLPANIYPIVQAGGSFDITSGQTLTMRSPRAGAYQIFYGSGTVSFSAVGADSYVYTEWWGANDGVHDGSLAFNAAVVAAHSLGVPIKFQSQIYAYAAGLKVNYPYLTLEGPASIFTASTSGVDPGTVFKFISGGTGTAGLTTLTNPSDSQGQPYVTLRNIAIDCNAQTDYGFIGGFFTTLDNDAFSGCNVAGFYSKNGQQSNYSHSSFNANLLDGVLLTGGTTQTFTSNTFNNNTRDGVNIQNADNVTFNGYNVWECNGGSATAGTCPVPPGTPQTGYPISITGASNGIFFNLAYAENGDMFDPSDGANMYVDDTSPYSDNIVVKDSSFGSTGNIAVANIQAGDVIFQNSSEIGNVDIDNMILGTNGKVTLQNSFDNVPMPAAVYTVPNVTIPQPETYIPIVTGHGSVADISSSAITLGTGDFTVSMVLTPIDMSNNSRTILSGSPGSLGLVLLGSSRGLTTLGVELVGTGYVSSTLTLPYVRLNTPQNIVYTRTSGVGTIYQNGVFAGSFADTSNYSAILQQVGMNYANGTYGDAIIYNTVIMSGGITQAQATQLWQSGGLPFAGLPTIEYSFGATARNIAGSLTTTAATSDTLTLPGMTAMGYCSLTATNSAAATNLATTYISAKSAGTITVTHTATAGMTYDVSCTAY